MCEFLVALLDEELQFSEIYFNKFKNKIDHSKNSESILSNMYSNQTILLRIKVIKGKQPN